MLQSLCFKRKLLSLVLNNAAEVLSDGLRALSVDPVWMDCWSGPRCSHGVKLVELHRVIQPPPAVKPGIRSVSRTCSPGLVTLAKYRGLTQAVKNGHRHVLPGMPFLIFVLSPPAIKALGTHTRKAPIDSSARAPHKFYTVQICTEVARATCRMVKTADWRRGVNMFTPPVNPPERTPRSPLPTPTPTPHVDRDNWIKQIRLCSWNNVKSTIMQFPSMVSAC